jgi:hypothetical protein
MVRQPSALTLAIIPIAEAEQEQICGETIWSILSNIHAKIIGGGYAKHNLLKIQGLYPWQKIQLVLMEGTKRNNVNRYDVINGNNMNPYYGWIGMVLCFGIDLYRL